MPIKCVCFFVVIFLPNLFYVKASCCFFLNTERKTIDFFYFPLDFPSVLFKKFIIQSQIIGQFSENIQFLETVVKPDINLLQYNLPFTAG